MTLANTINFNATTTISNTADLTLSGAINTSGTVSKTGTGTLYPTADNSSKTLNLTVSQGTLSVASASALGDRNGYFTLNGGTLQTTASMDLAKYFIYATANSTINTAAATTFTISSTISGSSSLAKTGVGTLVLSANNYTFGGDTIGNAAHLGSDNLAFNGGTLASTDTLTLSNAITLAAAARTHAVPLARLSFKGALATLRHWTPLFAVCAGSPSLVRRRFDQLLSPSRQTAFPSAPAAQNPASSSADRKAIHS